MQFILLIIDRFIQKQLLEHRIFIFFFFFDMQVKLLLPQKKKRNEKLSIADQSEIYEEKSGKTKKKI